MRRLSNKKTSKAGGSRSTGGIDWDIPNSQEDGNAAADRSQHGTNPTKVTASASEGTITQDDLYPPVKAQELAADHVDHSPTDTVMDTSSSNRPATTGPSRPSPLDLGFGNHEPNELFLNSTNIDGSSAATPQTQGTIAEDLAAEQEQAPSVRPPQSPITPNLNDADELQLPANSYFEKRTKEQTKSSSTNGQKATNEMTTAKDFSSQITTSDELAAEGLAKEMYIPRPSRSRGVEVTQKESVTPKATANKSKARPKRRKTTGFTLSSPRSMLVEMGFSASDADRALLETDNDVHAAAALLAGGSASQKSKSARKSKLLTVNEEDEDDGVDAPVVSTNPGKDNGIMNDVDVAGTANNKRKRAPSKTPGISATAADDTVATEGSRATKTNQALDDSDEEEDDEVVQPNSRRRRHVDHAALDDIDKAMPEDSGPAHAAQSAAQAAATTGIHAESTKTKRGRGRPKKSEVMINEQDDELNELAETATEPAEQQVEAQPAKKGRGRPKKTPELLAEESEDEEPVNAQECAQVRISQHDKTVLQETSANKLDHANTESTSMTKTPTKDSDKATANTSPQKRHSPLNHGRVPIKVGLSRRMRIEPLLKIIRK